MKRLLIIFFFFSLSIPVLRSEIVPLTIMSTNDLHGYLLPHEENRGGAARIAAYYKKVQSEENNVLILDAGDMISGTAISSMFKGDPIFHVANHWGIDAGCIGNHEFDYGWQRIERYRNIANFPFLCANAYVMTEKGTHELIGDAEYIIIEKGSLKIGVIGIVSENTPQMTTKFATDGVHFTKEIETLDRLVPIVSAQCDMLIALTHIGCPNDRGIDRNVEGIDLIIGGHTHTRIDRITRGKKLYSEFIYFNNIDNTPAIRDVFEKRNFNTRGI